MLHVALSNRFEALLDTFVGHAGRLRGDPFEPLTVIVPSAAVQRALTLRLADRQGVCAHVDFSYPAAWLWRLIARAVPGVGAGSPFDPQVLAWRVYRALGDVAFTAPHARLAAWLREADDVMRFELAGEVATLLEQYATYRPDWVVRWGDGLPATEAGALLQHDDEAWQAALWRRIASELSLPNEHPARALVRALEAGQDIGLPRAVHAIGLPALPPVYLELLQELGRFTDVHVYALNPCRAYWFDVVSSRRLSWLKAHHQADLFEQGHRLLADWGRQTRAFLGALVNFDGEAEIDDGGFVPAGGGTLLATLHDSILEFEEPAPRSIVLAPGDRSLEIHVCHSATRELEVLHDVLLGLFAEDPTLSPADILVVMPGLAERVPLIQAVFGAAPPARHIPFTITGLPEREANPYSRLLLDLLAFVHSRWTVTDLLALLQHEAVARRFALDDAALEDLQAWAREAGMHWALDGAHRATFGVPGTDKHSLDDGLQRLVLGYALPDTVDAPLLGRLPAGAAEGSAARPLGALAEVLGLLRRLRDEATQPRPGPEWCRLLLDTLEALAAPSRDDVADLFALRRSLALLQERMAAAAALEPVPLAVVHAALGTLLEEPARGAVPSGTVTFAAWGHLRGLPYRVICAIGLDDGVVPAAASPLEFDLMTRHARAGDRQRRIDERNVFLDLLLAGRDRLVLSHVGRSVRDNARLPPSILVGGLLDFVLPALALDEATARERLVVEHPLQPFAAENFTAADPRRRSFHEEYARALREAAQAAATRFGPQPGEDDEESDLQAAWDPRALFVRSPLAAPDASWHDVPLARLVEFFRNPSRFLLRHRLAIDLPRQEVRLEDDEPMPPGWRERSALAERLLPRALAGAALEELRTLARAGVEYPAGPVGEAQIDAELAVLQDYVRRVRADTAEPVLPPRTYELPVDLDGVTWRVSAAFADLRPGGLVRHNYDETRVHERVAAWVHHVVLCAAAPPGVTQATRWHSRDGGFAFAPVARAGDVLADLVRLYARGLREPLRFFPRSAWDYVAAGESLERARDRWVITPFRPHNESSDAGFALAMRGVAEPIDDDFAQCAKTVFDPLLASLEDPRL